MISKDDIQRGDVIAFRGNNFVPVFSVTPTHFIVGIDQYRRRAIKRNAFRVTRINGRFYANVRLEEVLI